MWKRDQADTSSSPPRNPSTDTVPADRKWDKESIVDLGKSLMIKGELSGSEDLTLCGHMEGSITLSAHTLTIGAQADIKAEISAKTVVIIGAVTGNVTAGEKVEIRATGSVTGDIESPRLVIADGGGLCGKVQIPKPKPGPAAQKS